VKGKLHLTNQGFLKQIKHQKRTKQKQNFLSDGDLLIFVIMYGIDSNLCSCCCCRVSVLLQKYLLYKNFKFLLFVFTRWLQCCQWENFSISTI